MTSWENWPLKTQSGDFEAVFSNVGINAARVKLFDFSSYRAAYMGFEAKKSSSYDIKGSDDISGLKISVGSGTNQEKILIAWNKELEAKGKAPAVLQYYSSDADTILALSSGRTDLNIAPYPSVTYRENTRDDLKVVGKVNAGWPSETLVAATTLKGNGLAPAITDALNSAIKDGSYAKVLDRWGLSEEALPESKTVTEANFGTAPAGKTNEVPGPGHHSAPEEPGHRGDRLHRGPAEPGGGDGPPGRGARLRQLLGRGTARGRVHLLLPHHRAGRHRRRDQPGSGCRAA